MAQRKARLYTALVERGLASSVSGAPLPTAQPFLYTLALTAIDGVGLESLQSALLDAVERLQANGVTDAEAARARKQLRARLVFENDSITNIAHQLGYFDTVVKPRFPGSSPQAGIDGVTAEQVNDVARRRLGRKTRTVGWFQPQD